MAGDVAEEIKENLDPAGTLTRSSVTTRKRARRTKATKNGGRELSPEQKHAEKSADLSVLQQSILNYAFHDRVGIMSYPVPKDGVMIGLSLVQGGVLVHVPNAQACTKCFQLKDSREFGTDGVCTKCQPTEDYTAKVVQ